MIKDKLDLDTTTCCYAIIDPMDISVVRNVRTLEEFASPEFSKRMSNIYRIDLIFSNSLPDTIERFDMEMAVYNSHHSDFLTETKNIVVASINKRGEFVLLGELVLYHYDYTYVLTVDYNTGKLMAKLTGRLKSV